MRAVFPFPPGLCHIELQQKMRKEFERTGNKYNQPCIGSTGRWGDDEDKDSRTYRRRRTGMG